MLAEVVDRAACVAAFGDWQGPINKHRQDLARYEHVLAVTQPEVVVECGTRTGWSARWFADHGCDVVTVDIQPPDPQQAPRHDRLMYVGGDTVADGTFAVVEAVVAGRRCMVSLDSDHSEAHVRREIELYRELVTPGCHLVVEDGVIDWLPSPKPHGCDVYTGSVLAAIEDTLAGDERFVRDDVVEASSPVTMFPAGWWLRRG
jgi:cephalosporin hydroxylase